MAMHKAVIIVAQVTAVKLTGAWLGGGEGRRACRTHRPAQRISVESNVVKVWSTQGFRLEEPGWSMLISFSVALKGEYMNVILNV